MSEDRESLFAKREELRRELAALDEEISAVQAAEKQPVIENARSYGRGGGSARGLLGKEVSAPC